MTDIAPLDDDGMALTRIEQPRTGGAERAARRLSTRPHGLAAGMAALLLGLFSGGDGYGYRFYLATDDVSLPVSGSAARWDSASWGSRDTLQWVIADDPGWTSSWESVTPEGETRAEDPPFRRAREAAPFVAQALAAWTAVRSADIRWEVAGVEEGPGDARDGRSMVTALTAEDFGHPESTRAYAALWLTRRGAEWRLVECDVVLRSSSAAVLRSEDPASLATLIHEFGHCIGLAHAEAHSIWEGLHGAVSAWEETPKMSYGVEVTNHLTLDDIVGASLLRPAGSWGRSVGSISGRVDVGRNAARFVPVLAARLTGGDVGPGVSAFTDERGRFLIEGLVPGDYLISAGPMLLYGAHSELLARGATLDVRDGFRLDPVSVRAGTESGGVTVALQWGR